MQDVPIIRVPRMSGAPCASTLSRLANRYTTMADMFHNLALESASMAHLT